MSIECQVCLDDFPNTIITMSCCETNVCENCLCEYLKDCSLTPQCLNCESAIPLEFLLANLNKKILQTKYFPRRAKLLMNIQLDLLPQSKLTEAAYSNGINCLNAYSRYESYLVSTKQTNTEEYVRVQKIISQCERCVKVFGRGFESKDLEIDVPIDLLITKKFRFNCPNDGCYGKVVDGYCELCNSQICVECHWPVTSKRNDEGIHKCDKNDVLSIIAQYKESHPCPKCIASISKVDGCDQMFCTQCHTTFSWTTGEIILHGLHNPHYFEWKRQIEQKENVTRLEQDNLQDNLQPCGIPLTYLSYHDLLSCFSPELLQRAKILNSKLIPTTNFYDKFL